MAGRGVDVHAGMLFETDVVLRGKKPTALPKSYRLSTDPEDLGGGTPNMKLHFPVVLWLWAWLTGVGVAVARQRLLFRLSWELYAHGHGEPLSPSHSEQHHGPLGAALKFALAEDEHGKPRDAEVANLIIEWYRVEYALLRACETVAKDKRGRRIQEPWTAGGRGIGEDGPFGANGTWVKFLKAVRGEPIPGKIDQYDVGARCLATLPEKVRQRIQAPPEAYPPMWRAFHVRRYGEGPDAPFVCWYDGSRALWKDSTMSAGCLGGERWATKDRDEEKIAAYASLGTPTLVIDAPAANLNERGALIIPGRTEAV